MGLEFAGTVHIFEGDFLDQENNEVLFHFLVDVLLLGKLGSLLEIEVVFGDNVHELFAAFAFAEVFNAFFVQFLRVGPSLSDFHVVENNLLVVFRAFDFVQVFGQHFLVVSDQLFVFYKKITW